MWRLRVLWSCSLITLRSQSLALFVADNPGLERERHEPMRTIDEFIAFVGAGLAKTGEGFQEFIGVGLEAAPALVLGLGVIAALPALILAGFVLRRVAPAEGLTSRYVGPLPEPLL